MGYAGQYMYGSGLSKVLKGMKGIVKNSKVDAIAVAGFSGVVTGTIIARACGIPTAFLKEYVNHSALNLGQAARDVRWIYNHPDADKMGPEGSAKHIAASVTSRIPSLASNLYYAALPPQLHHSDEELKEIKDENPKDNFLLGYAPWVYRKKEKTAL